MGEQVGDEIRYHVHRAKCLAFPETEAGRKDSDAFTRRMAGADSWEMGERFPK